MSRTKRTITRQDGITQADVDANIDTIVANVRRGAQLRAQEAGMSDVEWVQSFMLPSLEQAGNIDAAQWIRSVFGIAEEEPQ